MLPQLQPTLPMAMLLLLKVLPLLYAVMEPLPLLALLCPMAMLLVGTMLLTLLELFMWPREKLKLMLMLSMDPLDTIVLDTPLLLGTQIMHTLLLLLPMPPMAILPQLLPMLPMAMLLLLKVLP